MEGKMEEWAVFLCDCSLTEGEKGENEVPLRISLCLYGRKKGKWAFLGFQCVNLQRSWKMALLFLRDGREKSEWESCFQGFCDCMGVEKEILSFCYYNWSAGKIWQGSAASMRFSTRENDFSSSSSSPPGGLSVASLMEPVIEDLQILNRNLHTVWWMLLMQIHYQNLGRNLSFIRRQVKDFRFRI